jgi:hypothetical protein
MAEILQNFLKPLGLERVRIDEMVTVDERYHKIVSSHPLNRDSNGDLVLVYDAADSYEMYLAQYPRTRMVLRKIR